MKVRYNGSDCAYLDDEPLSDGSYVGTNKHLDEQPVHLRWDDVADTWVEVCHRDVHLVGPVYLDNWVADPAPEGCSCA